MYTKHTYKLIEHALNFAYYASGTAFYWDRRRREVKVYRGPWPRVDKFLALTASAVFFLSTLISYARYYHEFGLGLKDDAGLWKLCLLSVTALSSLYIIACHTTCHETALVVNSLVQICDQAQEVFWRHGGVEAEGKAPAWVLVGARPAFFAKLPNLVDLLFANIVVSVIFSYTSIGILVYGVQCEFYVLDTLFLDLICEIRGATLHPTWANFFILGKYVSLQVIQTTVLSMYAGSIVVYACVHYPLMFFLLEILHKMRRLEAKSHSSSGSGSRRRKRVGKTLQVYRSIQILATIFNCTNFSRITTGGNVYIGAVMFLITVNIALQWKAPLVMIAGGVAIGLSLLIHFAIYYSCYWRVTSASRALVRKLKNDAPVRSRWLRRKLRSMRPIMFNIG